MCRHNIGQANRLKHADLNVRCGPDGNEVQSGAVKTTSRSYRGAAESKEETVNTSKWFVVTLCLVALCALAAPSAMMADTRLPN